MTLADALAQVGAQRSGMAVVTMDGDVPQARIRSRGASGLQAAISTPPDALAPGALQARGWTVTDGQWRRPWRDARSDAARGEVAQEVLAALREGFGAHGEPQVRVEADAPRDPSGLIGPTLVGMVAGVAIILLLLYLT